MEHGEWWSLFDEGESIKDDATPATLQARVVSLSVAVIIIEGTKTSPQKQPWEVNSPTTEKTQHRQSTQKVQQEK